MTTPARVAAAAVIGVLRSAAPSTSSVPLFCSVRRPVTHADSEPDTARLVDGSSGGGTVRDGPIRSVLALDLSVPTGPETARWASAWVSPGAPKTRRTTSPHLVHPPGGWEGAPRNSVALPVEGRPRGARGWFSCGVLRSIRTRAGPRRRPTSPVGPTVDDFANALVAHPRSTSQHLSTSPWRGTKGSVRPRRAGPQVPNDTTTPVADQEYWPWEPGFRNDAGSRWHLWTSTSTGSGVVIQAMDFAGTPAKDQAALRGVVDSFQIPVLTARRSPPPTTPHVERLRSAPHRRGRAGGSCCGDRALTEEAVSSPREPDACPSVQERPNRSSATSSPGIPPECFVCSGRDCARIMTGSSTATHIRSGPPSTQARAPSSSRARDYDADFEESDVVDWDRVPALTIDR